MSPIGSLSSSRRRRATSCPIWVIMTHFAKYFDLEPFHQRGICVTDVVIAHKMQQPMHDQMRGMIRQGFAAAAASAAQVS